MEMKMKLEKANSNSNMKLDLNAEICNSRRVIGAMVAIARDCQIEWF